MGTVVQIVSYKKIGPNGWMYKESQMKEVDKMKTRYETGLIFLRKRILFKREVL